MSNSMMMAFYARVSSDQQAKNGTIESQISALIERIAADGGKSTDDMRFIDAGVSGATLIRPQLERLRDRAALGDVDRLYVLSPDRLSRKYAHQVLLMEELSACGVEVVFLNHAIGTTPEEALLLQMQGMFSEYERAKIMERNRRGKLHAAKRGSVNVLSTAPFGYRYVRKQADGSPAQYVIDLPQAATVRNIFTWIGIDRLSIGEVVRRLAETGIVSASGKPVWDRSTVWGMLQNPAYMGKAAFGKTHGRDPLPRVRPQRHSAETRKKTYSSVRTEPGDWIEIPVPAIINEGLFLAVHEQLDENRKSARQSRHGAAYLLQGLTVCGHCHYAFYGKKVSKAAGNGGREYAYYRCIGTDAYRFGGVRICDNHQVRTNRLDELVWQQVVALLAQPDRLRTEYRRRLDVLERSDRDPAETISLEKQKLHLEKGKSRLIDSYADELIDKTDFDPKIRQFKVRLEQINQQIDESRHRQTGQFELFLVISRLEEFAAAVNDKLSTVDFATKREIIRALVKRIEIHKEEIIVVFRVDPGQGFSDDEDSTNLHAGKQIMQDRSRRHQAALRRPLRPLHDHAAIHDPGHKVTTDQPQHGLVVDSPR
jgi:site-specific DNA recombinase